MYRLLAISGTSNVVTSLNHFNKVDHSRKKGHPDNSSGFHQKATWSTQAVTIRHMVVQMDPHTADACPTRNKPREPIAHIKENKPSKHNTHVKVRILHTPIVMSTIYTFTSMDS